MLADESASVSEDIPPPRWRSIAAGSTAPTTTRRPSRLIRTSPSGRPSSSTALADGRGTTRPLERRLIDVRGRGGFGRFAAPDRRRGGPATARRPEPPRESSM